MEEVPLHDDDEENAETEKQHTRTKEPFKILKIAVDRIVSFAIPYHLEKLKTHNECIKDYRERKEWALLLSEQVEASNVVRLLKSDLYELRELSYSLREDDIPLFQETIQGPTEDVISAIAAFLEDNSNAMQPVPKLDFLADKSNPEFPALVCDLTGPPNYDEQMPELALVQSNDNILAEPLKAQKHWAKLKSELYELNELFKRFASFVFTQKESVDNIEANVQTARDNVVEGTRHLRRAVVLQAATFPAAGAAIGGLLLGPVGAIAGFKLFGTVACAVSGSVLGYGAGVKLKKKRQAICDIEMKAITCSSKSLSTPDLTNSSQ